jgi:hypothetical protein
VWKTRVHRGPPRHSTVSLEGAPDGLQTLGEQVGSRPAQGGWMEAPSSAPAAHRRIARARPNLPVMARWCKQPYPGAGRLVTQVAQPAVVPESIPRERGRL